MGETTDQSDPLEVLCSVLGEFQPDELPLRELVIAELRKNKKMLREIANGEEHDYEGNLITLRSFIKNKAWPEEDEGWVDETLSLTRWSNWYLPSERPSYMKRSRGSDRPGKGITLRMLCASALVADCARHAPFSGCDTEPGADTCVALVEAACRLGGVWPEAVSRWLADQALYWTRSEDWSGFESDAIRYIAVPLAVLAAWRSVREGAQQPVYGLFEAIDRVTTHRGAQDLSWLEPIDTILEGGPGVLKDSVFSAIKGQLPEETRKLGERICERFLG